MSRYCPLLKSGKTVVENKKNSSKSSKFQNRKSKKKYTRYSEAVGMDSVASIFLLFDIQTHSEMLPHYWSLVNWARPSATGRSASPPRPAAGHSACLSIQQHFLPSTPLISRSHVARSCLWPFIFLGFSFHLFCVTLCFYFLHVFNERCIFQPQADFFNSFSLSLFFFLICWSGSWKVCTPFDNLNQNVLMHSRPHAGLSPENWNQWKRPLPNVITLMNVWPNTQEIRLSF